MMNNKPVSYLQTDSRWAKWPYSNKNEDTDIAESGCGPTSMAMVIATWKDPSVTPVTTCKWALNHGYKATGNGTYHSYFVPQAAAYGITCERVNTTSFAYMYASQAEPYHKKAYDAVEEGNLVICLMSKGNWTNGGHFIVWYSNDSSGNVYINDPASTKSNRVKNKYSLLKSQVRYYWICKVPKEVISMLNSEVRSMIKSEVSSQLSSQLTSINNQFTSVNNKINEANTKITNVSNSVAKEAKTQANTAINKYFTALNGPIPSSWAEQAWYSACRAGKFDWSNPKMYMTREQVATVMMRNGDFDKLDLPENFDFENHPEPTVDQ